MVKTGDYVVYKPNNNIGRVTKVCKEGCFVCYTTGCTASFTDWVHLRKPTQIELQTVNPNLGFNRFNDHCDLFNEDYCFVCKNKLQY